MNIFEAKDSSNSNVKQSYTKHSALIIIVLNSSVELINDSLLMSNKVMIELNQLCNEVRVWPLSLCTKLELSYYFESTPTHNVISIAISFIHFALTLLHCSQIRQFLSNLKA